MMAKLDSYNSIADMVSRVEYIYNNTDGGLFKFDTKLGDEYEANVVVAQYCEEKCSHNEKHDDTNTPEDADQHFLTQQINILINDIIKGTVYESELEPSFDNVNKERWIVEEDHTWIEV